VFVVGPTGLTTNTARLSPRYEGKTRGCYCSRCAPDDGRETPETCWAVNKRQNNKLESCCIWLVIWIVRWCTDLQILNLVNFGLNDRKRPHSSHNHNYSILLVLITFSSQFPTTCTPTVTRQRHMTALCFRVEPRKFCRLYDFLRRNIKPAERNFVSAWRSSAYFTGAGRFMVQLDWAIERSEPRGVGASEIESFRD